MGALNSLASLGLNLALNQRAQAAEDKQLKQERDRQLKAIDLRDSEDRRQQELSLRRRLAEERHGRHFATFGTDEALQPSPAEEQIRRRRTYALALDNLVVAFRRAVERGDVETMVPAYRAIWQVIEVRGPIAVAVELSNIPNGYGGQFAAPIAAQVIKTLLGEHQ